MSAKSIRQRIASLFLGGDELGDAVPLPKDGFRSQDEIYRWIVQGIGRFKEWYQPVDFGNGVIAHQTCPPDWAPRPELLNDVGGGLAKWNYIVRKHLPDVSGMRVLDVGCSSGLFSLELARMGAREVIGIDRDSSITHRSTKVPPRQNVIAQANFVKQAFEFLEARTYPVTYVARDIGQLTTQDLGRFDLILALCVVYHELERMPRLVETLAGMANHLVLQANEAHGGGLAKYSNAKYHVQLLRQLGFRDVSVDAPSGYMLPLIVAKR